MVKGLLEYQQKYLFQLSFENVVWGYYFKNEFIEIKFY